MVATLNRDDELEGESSSGEYTYETVSSSDEGYTYKTVSDDAASSSIDSSRKNNDERNKNQDGAATTTEYETVSHETMYLELNDVTPQKENKETNATLNENKENNNNNTNNGNDYNVGDRNDTINSRSLLNDDDVDEMPAYTIQPSLGEISEITMDSALKPSSSTASIGGALQRNVQKQFSCIWIEHRI